MMRRFKNEGFFLVQEAENGDAKSDKKGSEKKTRNQKQPVPRRKEKWNKKRPVFKKEKRRNQTEKGKRKKGDEKPIFFFKKKGEDKPEGRNKKRKRWRKKRGL